MALLNLGGNTKAFVPFGGESLFCIQEGMRMLPMDCHTHTGISPDGSGTVAGHVEQAKKLGLPLIDTDAYIVEQEGRSIPEIFAQEGEPYFRKVEAQAIRTLCTKNAVIACGGGAMLNPDSAAYARENGAVVLLNESFDTCYARIQGDTNRPIVQRSTKEELHQLFDQRAGIYRAHASHVVDGGVSPEQMAERVAAAVQ